MALYVTRPRRDEVRIGRGLPSAMDSSDEWEEEVIKEVMIRGLSLFPAFWYLVHVLSQVYSIFIRSINTRETQGATEACSRLKKLDPSTYVLG